MARVLGPGGFFFKVNDPENLKQWYSRHLGLAFDEYGGVKFDFAEQAQSDRESYVLWGMFRADTDYFGPHKHDFMFNFRVDDLDGILERLAAEGVEILPEREEEYYGRFAWVLDPEGHKIELWEPPLRQGDTQ
ncbi:VOC family protein [Luteithermobacter gelatinilyticus]|uniref:VOC family protein n=1 Tax=Luteithermobacter gelatinilyticus TaxID=2582913 RepID=UPI0011070E95|nr:VOC family protein [Luteithermobacter gelatinilyticus]